MSLHDIFDLGDDRYTAQVVPDAYPAQPQPRLSNWSAEDREAFCGEYPEERLHHYGPDPGHGGLTRHIGSRKNCSGPDCDDEAA
ncbi:hypothetical protein [Actinophytocola sp. NPDC049390]|uniref:hypothetical protein n=1 Tax=Actinophytocola sp. NPDC049390 TaxID=3363894 RepID=UPI0037A3B79B